MMNRIRIQRTTTRRKQQRKGAATIVAISFLVVITLLLVAMTRLLATSRDQSRTQVHRLESEWLVEIGQQQVQRGLAANPEYAGESWRLDATGDTKRIVTMTRNDEKQQMIVTAKIKRGKRTLAGATRSIPLVEEVNVDEN